MAKRLVNSAARRIINKHLTDIGFDPLSAELSYIEFATEVSKILEPNILQIPFISRPDAVAYLRLMARQIIAGNLKRVPKKKDLS